MKKDTTLQAVIIELPKKLLPKLERAAKKNGETRKQHIENLVINSLQNPIA